MMTTVKSRKIGKSVTFFRSDSGGYIFCDLNGKPGTLGVQPCAAGELTGDTLMHYGDEKSFSRVCRAWMRSHVDKHADDYEDIYAE
jgi:hypothetical protein